MIRLNISDHRIQLPGSAFPSPASIYLCDNCERDITRHLYPPKSHSWEPLGPEKYTCLCGRQYLTGAMEWEHLSEWERRRRIRQTFGVGGLLSAIFAVLALGVSLPLAFLHHRTSALLAAFVLIALPFILFVVPFWFEVAASKWRTRR
jgi:hypothetical protein